MKKIIDLVLVCCMCAGLAACGMTAENITTQPMPNEPTVTAYNTEPMPTTETIATIPTAAKAEIPEITLDMLCLSEHSQDIPEHCNPMYCHWDCDEHCDERCIQHAPTYVGIPVHAPMGFIYVVARFTPEERETVGSFDLSKTFVMEVNPDTQFTVAGVRYVTNIEGEQDSERESDFPLTEDEMGELCAAIPISNSRTGLVYVIDPQTSDFLLVIPYTIEVVPNWWK